MNETARRIRESIENKKLTFQQLARITGYPKSALQRYASGVTVRIPIDRLRAIADACGVSAQYLLCWDEKPSEESNYSDLQNEAIKLITECHDSKILQMVVDILHRFSD